MRDRTLPQVLALTLAAALTVVVAFTLGSSALAGGGAVPAVDEPTPPPLVEITTEEPLRLGPLAPVTAPFPHYEPPCGAGRGLVVVLGTPTT